MSMIASSSSVLTFFVLALNIWRLPSSIFTYWSFSYSSLILTSFSIFCWYNFRTLYFMAFMKVDPMEDMVTRYSRTFPVMGVFMRTEIGFPPVTDTFFTYSCTILPYTLSYVNFFRLGTSLGLNGVQSPKPNPSNGVYLLPLVIDISRISVSIT